MSRVLVVEDDTAIRAFMSMALRDAGYTVDAVPDGEQALQRALELRPAAIVLDLALPNMSGWQFVGACRDDPTCRTVPILVISAEYDLRSAAASLYEQGVHACIAKPFDPDVLVGAVERLVGRATAQ